MKSGDGKVSLLKEVPLFWACSDKELRKIARIADEVDRPAGAVLIKEGEAGRELFVIADGSVKITRGKRKIATVGRGNVIGELAVLDHGPRSATVTTETPVKLFVIDARSFSALIEDAPTVGYKIAKTLAERLRSAENSPTH